MKKKEEINSLVQITKDEYNEKEFMDLDDGALLAHSMLENSTTSITNFAFYLSRTNFRPLKDHIFLKRSWKEFQTSYKITNSIMKTTLGFGLDTTSNKKTKKRRK